MNTTTASNTTPNPSQTRAHARALVSAALERYADEIETNRLSSDADIDLLRKMSYDVTGWTHTTRLTDFLKRVSA